MGTEIAKNSKTNGLSDDDICTFKKLNCPSLVPVEEYYQSDDELMIYPNPASSQYVIEFNINPDEDKVSILLFNSLGINILNFLDNQIFTNGKHRITVPVENLSFGKYYYQIRIGKSSEVKSIVVIR